MADCYNPEILSEKAERYRRNALLVTFVVFLHLDVFILDFNNARIFGISLSSESDANYNLPFILLGVALYNTAFFAIYGVRDYLTWISDIKTKNTRLPSIYNLFLINPPRFFRRQYVTEQNGSGTDFIYPTKIYLSKKQGGRVLRWEQAVKSRTKSTEEDQTIRDAGEIPLAAVNAIRFRLLLFFSAEFAIPLVLYLIFAVRLLLTLIPSA